VKHRIEAQIQKKVEGEEITVPAGGAAAASGAKVIDIMDALRASLKRKQGGAGDDGDESRERKPVAGKPTAKKGAKKAAKKIPTRVVRKAA